MFNNIPWLLFFCFTDFSKKTIIVELIATGIPDKCLSNYAFAHDFNTRPKYFAYLTRRVIDVSEFFARQGEPREKEREMKRDRDGIAK